MPLARSKCPKGHLHSIPEGILPGHTYYKHEVSKFLNVEPKDYAFIPCYVQGTPPKWIAEGEPII